MFPISREVGRKIESKIRRKSILSYSSIFVITKTILYPMKSSEKQNQMEGTSSRQIVPESAFSSWS